MERSSGEYNPCLVILLYPQKCFFRFFLYAFSYRANLSYPASTAFSISSSEIAAVSVQELFPVFSYRTPEAWDEDREFGLSQFVFHKFCQYMAVECMPFSSVNELCHALVCAGNQIISGFRRIRFADAHEPAYRDDSARAAEWSSPPVSHLLHSILMSLHDIRGCSKIPPKRKIRPHIQSGGYPYDSPALPFRRFFLNT